MVIVVQDALVTLRHLPNGPDRVRILGRLLDKDVSDHTVAELRKLLLPVEP